METLNPVECKEYPGYYHIPDEPAVAATPDGKFLHLKTGRPIKPGPIYDTYWKISFTRDEKTINRYVHRLLARTFIGRPDRHLDKDHSELEVNHIDANKANNSLCNLEWVTSAENSQHAISMDRMEFVPILCKDIRTGEITRIRSITECAEKFDINLKRLRRHLTAGDSGRRTKNWCVFKYDDERPWVKLTPGDYQENTWDIAFGVWYAASIEGGKTYFNRTLSELSDVLCLPYTAIQSYLRGNKRGVYGGYRIWFDDRPVKETIDQIKTRKNNPDGIREPKKVRVVTGNREEIYDSVIKAAKALDVSQNTISYAIKTRGGKIKDSIVSYI